MTRRKPPKRFIRKYYSPATIAHINSVLGNNLMVARNAAMIRQDEAAIHLYGRKTQKARISEMESGKKMIDLYKLIQMAELYGVSLDYLLGRSTEPINDIYANHINYVQLCAKKYFEPVIEQMTDGLIDFLVKVDKDTHYQLVECAKEVAQNAVQDLNLRYNSPKLYQSLLKMTDLVRQIEVAHAKKMTQINTQLAIIAEKEHDNKLLYNHTQYTLPLPNLEMEEVNG